MFQTRDVAPASAAPPAVPAGLAPLVGCSARSLSVTEHTVRSRTDISIVDDALCSGLRRRRRIPANRTTPMEVSTCQLRRTHRDQPGRDPGSSESLVARIAINPGPDPGSSPGRPVARIATNPGQHQWDVSTCQLRGAHRHEPRTRSGGGRRIPARRTTPMGSVNLSTSSHASRRTPDRIRGPVQTNRRTHRDQPRTGSGVQPRQTHGTHRDEPPNDAGVQPAGETVTSASHSCALPTAGERLLATLSFLNFVARIAAKPSPASAPRPSRASLLGRRRGSAGRETPRHGQCEHWDHSRRQEGHCARRRRTGSACFRPAAPTSGKASRAFLDGPCAPAAGRPNPRLND